MKLIFLDIDGVLNAHEHDPEVLCGQIHRDKVQLLNGVLRATDARIVLSSAWRYLVLRGEMNLRGMEWLLRSHGLLADRFIGITRPDTMERVVYNGESGTWPLCNERGQQITDWLKDNHGTPVDGYAVIDDLDLGISKAGHPFVETNGTIGMTKGCAEMLEMFLGAK